MFLFIYKQTLTKNLLKLTTMNVIIKQYGITTQFENVKKISAIIPDDKSDTRKAISVTYDYYDQGVKNTIDKVITLDPSLSYFLVTDEPI